MIFAAIGLPDSQQSKFNVIPACLLKSKAGALCLSRFAVKTYLMLRKCFCYVTCTQRPFAGAIWVFIVTVTILGITSITAKSQEKSKAKTNVPTSEKIRRWFEFDTFSISTRYRFIRLNNDRTSVNQLQYQFAGRGH